MIFDLMTSTVTRMLPTAKESTTIIVSKVSQSNDADLPEFGATAIWAV